MNALNVRLLVILVVVVLVLGVGVFAVNRLQVGRTAPAFLEEATKAKEAADAAKEESEAAFKGGDFAAADEAKDKYWESMVKSVNMLTQYTKLRPDDLDALEQLGYRLEETFQYGEAFNTLERLLREDPSRTEARRRVVNLAMNPRVRRFLDAKTHLEDHLLKDPELAEEGELWEKLGLCLFVEGKREEAVKTLETAIEKSPERPETYKQLADLLRLLNRAKEADAKMELMVETNPEDSRAYLIYGLYLRSTPPVGEQTDLERVESARQQFVKALELEKDSRDALYQLAESDLRLQAYYEKQQKLYEANNNPEKAIEYENLAKKYLDEARQHAQRAIEIDKRFAPLYITMATVEVQSDQWDAALDVLTQGLKETQENPELLRRKVSLLIDMGRLDEAQPVLAKLRDTKYPPAQVDYLEGTVYLKQGNFKAAIDSFEKARPTLLTSRANMVKQSDVWTGQCYEALNNYDEALKSYQRALTIDPLFTQARAHVAAILLRLNRVDEALQEYSRLMRRPDAPASGWSKLAQILILKNLRLDEPQRNWEQAEKALDIAATKIPDDVMVPILRAEIRANQGRNDEAEQLILEARKKYPDNLRLWSSLLNIAQRQKNWDRAEEILTEFETKIPDEVAKRLLWAKYYVRRYEQDATSRLDAIAQQDMSQLSTADQMRLLRGLLQAALWVGDDEQIDRFAHNVLAKAPNDLNTRFLLFELAMRSAKEDRLAAVERELAEIRKIAPDDPVMLFAEAVRLTLQAEDGKPELLDEALKKLREVRQKRPNWSRAPLMIGGIYYGKGNLDAAMEFFGEAIDLGARNPEAIKQYIQLLWAHRRYDKAREVFEMMTKGQDELPEDLRRMKRDIYTPFDIAIAEEEARKVAANSTRARDHLFLGQVLETRALTLDREGNTIAAGEKVREAQQSLQKAIDLDPEAPESWVAMVRLLANTRRVDLAKQTIEQAKTKMTGDQVTLALAECYEMVGDTGQAETLYQEAFQADKRASMARLVADFYLRTKKLEKAEALLSQIVSGKITGDDTDKIQARRRLAGIYASRLGQENRRNAIALLEENLKAAGLAQDRRLLTGLLASDTDLAMRQRALELLGQMEDATPADQYNRARMLAAQDRWAEASRIFTSLLAGNPKPDYLATYIALAMQRDELETAESYLGTLEQKAPGSLATFELKARLLCRRGQHAEATKVMRDYVGNAAAQPANPADRMIAAAKVLEQLARNAKEPGQEAAQRQLYDDAETMYREFVRERPSKQLELAAFLARCGRTKGAMDLVKQAQVAERDLGGQATVCVYVLRGGKAAPEEASKAEAILQTVLERSQRAVPMLMMMADVRNRQKRFDEAEAFYREVIQKNPNHLVALNNLAVLLALQKTDLPEAKAMIDKAFTLADATLAGAMLDSKATVYTALGKTDVALQAINRAIAEKATAVRYFHQARAYEVAGNEAAAISSMKQAISLGLNVDDLEPLELPAYQKLLAKANAE